MNSNLLGMDVTNIVTRALSEAESELQVIDPTRSTLTALIEIATNSDDDVPALSVLATDSVLKDTFDDFLVASRAADLIEEGTLSLRTLAMAPTNSLLCTEQTVIAVVNVGDRIAGITATDKQFVTHTHETYRTHWDDAPRFTLRTPPLSTVRETLSADIGESIRADFDAVLAAVERDRGNGDRLDEVRISLLVAARNNVLLYDISRWGEDVGIASKATFSRTKTELEDSGLIATEKVPIDVGRPRLRLKLGDSQLTDAPASELAGVTTDLLT